MSLINRRLLSAAVIICLVVTSFAIAGTNESYAAAKVKVKKVAFSKKNVDVTLANKNAKVTVTLNKKVKGANCAYVTLKNGKKKIKVFTKSVKGKKITATIRCDYSKTNSSVAYPGKWKVTNVELKKGTASKKWQAGKWIDGTYYSGFYYTVFKAGKTLAKGTTKNKKTLTVKAGSATATTVTGPSSADIGSAQVYTVKVVNKANKAAVNSGSVKFTIKENNITTGTKTVAVNSSGVAQATLTIPKPTRDSYYITVTADYLGVAGKYRHSSGATGTTALKPLLEMTNAQFVSVAGGYEAQVTIMNRRTGKPIEGVLIELKFRTPANINIFDENQYTLERLKTDKDGNVKWFVESKEFKKILDTQHPQGGDRAIFTINDIFTYEIFNNDHFASLS